MAIKAVRSTSTNPWFNLALEHYLGQNLAIGDHLFYWWQNRPSVIVGYFQDAWAECAVDALKRDQVDLVRRPTGGGAVYHDLGNSNFTFWDSSAITVRNPLQDPLIKDHFRLIEAALQSFGLAAVTYGRNDLGIWQQDQLYKVSGSAFAYHAGKVLHHGTLLREVDFQKMQTYLHPHRLKRRAVASHPQPVLNLHSLNPTITHQNLGEVIKEKWLSYLAAEKQESWPGDHLAWTSWGEQDLPQLLQAGEKNFPYNQWITPAWNWGTAQHFAHGLDVRFSFGLFTLTACLDTDQRVQEVVIYSDTLQGDIIAGWQAALRGCPWQAQAVVQCLPHELLTPAQQAEVQAYLATAPTQLS